MTARKCAGTNRQGEPCGGYPLKGTTHCLAHSPKVAQSVGFIPDNGKAGRPRIPKVTEVARRLVEENAVALLTPHFRTLGYDIELDGDGYRLTERDEGGAKLYGTSKDGYVNVSSFDDLGAMVAASEKLLDRTHGRPRQATEVTGADGGPIRIEGDVDLARLSPEKLAALREILKEAEA